MLPLLLNLKIVLPALLILNALTLFIFRQELRFIKGPMALFILLFVTFLGYRFIISPSQTQQVKNTRQAEINKQGWDYLNDPEKDADFTKLEITYQQTNLVLFRITGLQAAFAFIFASIGIFAADDKKAYGGFAVGFFILAFLFLT